MFYQIRRSVGLILTVCTALATGCQDDRPPPPAQFLREIDWAESGVWLKADTHIHTQFSDGGVALTEVVRQGAAHGCDVMAITDHGDPELAATSDEYFEALDTARREWPDGILLAGLEWNVPPWKGREHATLLVPPGTFERQLLRNFQAVFDDWKRPDRDPDLAINALEWLEARPSNGGTLPLVIYNHPSRKRDDTNEFAEEYRRLAERSDLLVGFEGGPGHQESEPLGSYGHVLKTIDRWDPAVAQPGDAWDKLLQQGLPVWGAVATSDFHSAQADRPDDYWPGQFSETWLYAPDRSAEGALAALRAGSFFGVHGHIAREVQLTAYSAGLVRPAIAGEALRVPEGAIVDVGLTLSVPLLDWDHKANELHELELIAVLPNEVKTIAKERPKVTGQALDVSLVMPGTDVVIRARGRRIVPNGPDLLFYTNPIQLYAVGSTGRPLPASPPLATTPTAARSDAPSPLAFSASPPQAALTRSRLGRDLRLVPAWLVMAFVTGGGALLTLGVQWQVEIRRRFSRTNRPPVIVRRTAPLPLRRHLLAGLVCSIFLAVYGSWVPLIPVEMDWTTSVSRFQQVLRQPLSFQSRMDWTTNVVLFMPIGFFATGLLIGRMPSDRRRLTSLPIVILGSMLLSLGIEFGQLWIADRTCSQNDVVAETLGALLGGIGWLVSGTLVVRWLDRLRDSERPRQQIERALELYLLLVIVYMLLPMDLTFRPAELWRKFQQGRITFVPLADVTDLAAAMSVLSAGLLLLPVGAFAALWRWPDLRRTRPLATSMLMGATIVTAIEVGQVLVYSRYSSTTDLISGLVAVVAGWSIARVLVAGPASKLAQTKHVDWRLLFLFMPPLVFAAALTLVFCLPFDYIAGGDEVRQRLSGVISRSPLAALYWGTPLNAVFDVLRKLLLFGSLGVLIAIPVLGLVHSKRRQGRWLVAGWLAAVVVAAGIELVQLWLPPHVPDFTDLLLGSGGAAIGMICSYRLSRNL